MKQRRFLALLLIVLTGVSTLVIAESARLLDAPPTDAPAIYECTQFSLDPVDESLLTKEERLALMDQQLRESMDKYERCVSQVQSNMADGEAGLIDESMTGAQTQGEGASSSNDNLLASESSQNENTESQNVPSEVTQNTKQTPTKRGVVAPKDNDSIICKLLWEEIQKASPEKLAGFEKQYRDYKCG